MVYARIVHRCGTLQKAYQSLVMPAEPPFTLHNLNPSVPLLGEVAGLASPGQP